MTKQGISRMVRLYRKGRTIREISAELGVDSKTVWRHLRGVVEPRRTGPRGRADVTDELIVSLRDDDEMSWPQIAREVQMSRSGVRARYLLATTGERWR